MSPPRLLDLAAELDELSADPCAALILARQRDELPAGFQRAQSLSQHSPAFENAGRRVYDRRVQGLRRRLRQIRRARNQRRNLTRARRRLHQLEWRMPIDTDLKSLGQNGTTLVDDVPQGNVDRDVRHSQNEVQYAHVMLPICQE